MARPKEPHTDSVSLDPREACDEDVVVLSWADHWDLKGEQEGNVGIYGDRDVIAFDVFGRALWLGLMPLQLDENHRVGNHPVESTATRGRNRRLCSSSGLLPFLALDGFLIITKSRAALRARRL